MTDTSAYGWQVHVDGSAPGAKSDEPIGFGDLVFLKFAAKVVTPGPPPGERATRCGRGAALKQRSPGRLPPWEPAGMTARWRSGLRCPRRLGDGGCRGLLTAQFRKHRGGALLTGGSTSSEVGSGSGASCDPGKRSATAAAAAAAG